MEKVKVTYTHPEDSTKKLEVAGWHMPTFRPEDTDILWVRRYDTMMIDVPIANIIEKVVIPG